MARLLHANEPYAGDVTLVCKVERVVGLAMSAFFTAVKKEATCLHLRHVYDAIARRKVDIERCPGFRDTIRPGVEGATLD